MGEETKTVAAAPTDIIVAGKVEGAVATSPAQGNITHGICRNCGALLSGPFCSACGQTAHVHRSLLSLGHDILHGVLHFEGKIWRTFPELFFHPGRLTRRYIDGERAKFISPMALFLFCVFMMFVVFSFTGGVVLNSSSTNDGGKIVLGSQTLELAQRRTRVAELERQIADLQQELADPQLSSQRRTEIEAAAKTAAADLELARKAVAAAQSGDTAALADIDLQSEARKTSADLNFQTSSPALDRWFAERFKVLEQNPNLVLYKLKTNGYKFSWALVPLSIPFLWLLFFWRRDIHLYDHAIFVTYSISFIMLLLILCSLAAMAGVSSMIWGTALAFAPPIHMYKQLRGTYGLSRFGAFVRLFLLQIIIVAVMTLFFMALLILGLLD